MTTNSSSDMTEMLRDRKVNGTTSVGVYIINASIGSLGLLGNTVVIIVLLANWRSFQSLTHMFILHQSFIDLTSSFIFLALRMDHWQPLLKKGGTVGDVACKLWHSEFILWSLFMISTLNLTLLTTERFFAVVHPVVHLNRFTRSRVKVAMLIAWITGFSYQSYLATINERSSADSCVLEWTNGTTRVFVGVMTFVVEYLIPLTVMLVEYLFISIKLNKMKRAPTNRGIAIAMGTKLSNSRQASTKAKNYLLNPSGMTTREESFYTASRVVSQKLGNEQSSPGTPSAQPGHSKQKECKFSRAFRNVIKTLCLVFITFVICWTPSEFSYLYYNLGGQLDFEGTLHRLSVVLVLCNMCANPFIYALQYKEFQDNFLKMVYSVRELLPSCH